MSPTKTAAILRRLANDWRHEEAQLCKQFGDVFLPQSMRARRIKNTEAIDAAVEMIDRLEAAEKERDDVAQQLVQSEIGKREISEAHNAVTRRLSALAGENIALRAKIAEMEQQEPVAVVDDGHNADGLSSRISEYLPAGMMLYALPGAQGE